MKKTTQNREKAVAVQKKDLKAVTASGWIIIERMESSEPPVGTGDSSGS